MATAATAPRPMETVRRGFNIRFLDSPRITQALRQKVMGAYGHIASAYSFLTPDINLGAKRELGTPLTRTNYAEYEREFNSVLLGTVLNALVNGSMIFFGPPGSGKTTTPEVVGQVLFGKSLKEIEQATIYCHTNLTEEKMTASFDIPNMMQGQKLVIWSSWVNDFFRMLDEGNRMPPETWSILMQAVDRGRVTYAGEVKEMPMGPIYTTANYHDEGNFPLTRPALDRFAISVHAEGLSPQHLDLLFGRPADLDSKAFSLSKEEREEVYSEIQSIAIDRQTMSLLAHLASGLTSCDRSGNNWYDKHKGRFGEQKFDCAGDKCGFTAGQVVCSQINEQGMTTRSLIALRDYSRALSWVLDRESVDNEVMKIVFALVSAHRLTPSKVAMNGGESAQGVDVDKSLFVRKTTDFPYHIWELALNGFNAQNAIYAEIDAFYDAIAGGTQSRDALLHKSAELVTQVDNMEDPAKWEILKALHQVRQILRG